jgi:hypothetical protein
MHNLHTLHNSRPVNFLRSEGLAVSTAWVVMKSCLPLVEASEFMNQQLHLLC